MAANLFFNEKQELKLPNAHIFYVPQCFSKEDADAYFHTLRYNTNWQEDHISVFGKTYPQPRLTALYGSTKKSYTYANITMLPQPFTETLNTIKTTVETIAEQQFNTVLLNLYRHGNDSNGWHADNEASLGINPTIASVTFGEVRPFHFKHNVLKNQRYKLNLEHGSLLIMKGAMQHHWVHQIAKTKKNVKERINLTFRTLV